MSTSAICVPYGPVGPEYACCWTYPEPPAPLSLPVLSGLVTVTDPVLAVADIDDGDDPAQLPASVGSAEPVADREPDPDPDDPGPDTDADPAV